MKRLTVAWLSAFLFIGSALTSYAQTNSPIPERDSSSVSLFEYATKIPKRNKVFNLDLEMHAGFNADFFSGKLDEAAFRFRDVKNIYLYSLDLCSLSFRRLYSCA